MMKLFTMILISRKILKLFSSKKIKMLKWWNILKLSRLSFFISISRSFLKVRLHNLQISWKYENDDTLNNDVEIIIDLEIIFIKINYSCIIHMSYFSLISFSQVKFNLRPKSRKQLIFWLTYLLAFVNL